MNVQSVNSQVTNTGVSSNSSKEQNSLLSLGKKGDDIEGIITKVADQISINFNGKEVNIPKSSVQGATEGAVKKFKIMDISATSVKLKEVGVGKESAKAIQAYCTKIETDQAAFTKRMEEASKEEKEDSGEELEDTANRMTSDDSESLEDEGYDYRKFELERLELALTRVKEQREQKAENIDKQIEHNKEFVENVEKIAKQVLKTSPYAEQIIKKLEDSNLPITEANIKNILNAMNQSESIKNLSDASIRYVIDNDLDITLGNLYKAGYSSFNKNTSPISDKDYESISKQVKNIIKDSGYEVNSDTESQARFILDNELPLTTDTFNKLNQLLELRENYNLNNILDKVVSTLEQGNAIEDTQLVEDKDKQAQHIVDDIDTISNEAINRVVKEHKEQGVTIALLKKEQEKINYEQDQRKAEGSIHEEQVVDVETKVEKTKVVATSLVDIEAVKARRQLEEIRLKLTEDSVAKMSAKGIKVDTTNLERVVEELRKIEDDYYKNLLQETNTEATKENLAILKDTTSKVNDLKWMPSNLLADTFSNRSNATIDSLHEAGTSSLAKFAAVNESYESLMTAPRKDMGDSIQKAFNNSMADILAGLSLEDTSANKRAIRMLGYNGMEITSDNVAMMKEYDQKVNYLLKNLTPSVTMDLIKENINPVNIPIDELNQKIAKCKEENGYSDEDGYARYLWKLEQQDGITKDQRDAYIGIYRLLHNVDKTDGAAIGSLARSGKDITLGNLLSEVRTKRTGGIDKSVDDSFGMLSKVTYKTKTITDQIENGFSKDETSFSTDSNKDLDPDQVKIQYNQMLVKDILTDITPSQVETILESNNWSELSLEKLKELLNNAKEDSNIKNEFYSNQVKELRDLVKVSDEAIQFLFSHNMPISIQSIQEAQVLLNPSNIFRQLSDLSKTYEKNTKSVDNKFENVIEDISSNASDIERLQDSIDAFKNVADEIIDNQISDPEVTADQINSLALLKGAIRLATNLSKNEHYEIPIKVGDSITNISLTVMNNTKKQDSKIAMLVHSEQYGKIEAEFRFNNRACKALILCENSQTSNTIKESVGTIKQSMKNQNLTLVQLDIGVENLTEHSYIAKEISKDNKHQVTEEKVENKATTKELYQVAESFVILVKKLELYNNEKV